MKKISRREFIGLCSGTVASLGFVGSAWAIARASGHETMSHDLPLPPKGSFLRFDELALHNHPVFPGVNIFSFAAARNEIIGSNGTGKSTIAKLLASDNPDVIGQSTIFLRVSPNGCEAVLRRYRDLIHVGDGYTLRTRLEKKLSANGVSSELEERATEYFRRLVPHADSLLGKQSLFEFLRNGQYGFGDLTSAAYGFLFAERDLVNYRLPLVLDDPFNSMDIQHQRAFSALVSPMETQIILLTTEHQLRSSGWPSWPVFDSTPSLKMRDLPSYVPHNTTGELRRALHLSGSANRFFLA